MSSSPVLELLKPLRPRYQNWPVRWSSLRQRQYHHRWHHPPATTDVAEIGLYRRIIAGRDHTISIGVANKRGYYKWSNCVGYLIFTRSKIAVASYVKQRCAGGPEQDSPMPLSESRRNDNLCAGGCGSGGVVPISKNYVISVIIIAWRDDVHRHFDDYGIIVVIVISAD